MENNNLNNTNSNSSNMNYHKLIPVSIEEARNWYKGDDNVLKTLALRAFSEKELRHSFRDIKSFKDACDVLELNHDDLIPIIANTIIFGHSRASAAMFKLNIVKKALNLDYDLHLTKDPENSYIYCPFNILTTKDSIYYKTEINSGKFEIIGEIKSEGKEYYVLGNHAYNNSYSGLSSFIYQHGVSTSNGINEFLGCASKEIAQHFSKYFGMLITEAKYGDTQDFEIITSKYNNQKLSIGITSINTLFHNLYLLK